MRFLARARSVCLFLTSRKLIVTDWSKKSESDLSSIKKKRKTSMDTSRFCESGVGETIGVITYLVFIPGLDVSPRHLSLLGGKKLVRLYPLGFDTLHIRTDQQSSFCMCQHEYGHVRITMNLIIFIYKGSLMNCL